MGYYPISHDDKQFGPAGAPEPCATCAEAIARQAMFRFMNETRPEGEGWNPQVEMWVAEKTVFVSLEGYPSKAYTFAELGFTGCG